MTNTTCKISIHYFWILAIWIIISLVQGCSSSTARFNKLTTIYVASSYINPDINDQPSPLVVTLYQLRADSVFKDADFFSIYNNPKVTLGDDLIVRDQIEIEPNQKITKIQDMSFDTHCIGIVAAYRDLQNAQWRKIISIQKNKDTKIIVKLDAHNIKCEV